VRMIFRKINKKEKKKKREKRKRRTEERKDARFLTNCYFWNRWRLMAQKCFCRIEL
jgi:hypothetical protein